MSNGNENFKGVKHHVEATTINSRVNKKKRKM